MSNTVFDINKPDIPDDYNERINLDELYEKKKESDILKLSTYKKLLARIHNRIKLTSRQGNNIENCWFVVLFKYLFKGDYMKMALFQIKSPAFLTFVNSCTEVRFANFLYYRQE